MMEGTQIGDGREGEGPSEEALGRALARRLLAHPGLVLVAWSSQNLDRTRTVYEAARNAGRALVLDLYTATLHEAAGLAPHLGDPGLLVCPRERERLLVLKAREFHRTESVSRWRIDRKRLAARSPELVVMLRPSMLDELERAGALTGALAIWSMWRGYLENPSERRMRAAFARLRVPLVHNHVSGHAYICDLRRLVDAVQPGRVVPIHTEEPERYAFLFPRVERRADGAWWQV
jgi:ribonuclease J